MIILLLISIITCDTSYKYAMLQLSNIQLDSNKRLFGKKTHRYIRISQKNNTVESSTTSNYINECSIEWKTPIRFKPDPSSKIYFQIYQKQEFGSTPKDISSLIYGSFKIGMDDKILKIPVYQEGEIKNAIGHLIVNIKRRIEEVGRHKVGKDSVVIESMSVRKVADALEKCFMIVNTNNKTKQSPPMEATEKEFLTLKRIKLGHLLSHQLIQFQLYNYQNAQLIARAQIPYQSCSKQNKIALLTSKGQPFAQLWFQLNIPPKIQNKIKTPDKTPRPLRSQSNPNLLQKIILTPNMRIQNESQFLGKARKKKISIMNMNNDIYSPSEKRFMNYTDKQTDIISYSKLPSMDLENRFTKKYYRGASMGKGQRIDFTRYLKGTPGVGNYKLPSIFDKY